MPRKRKPIETQSHALRHVSLEVGAPVLGSPELTQNFDFKLRITGALRARVERAAAANGTSANREIARRLEESFSYGPTKELEAIASDMADVWANYDKLFRDLATRGDLVRAAEVLVETVEQLPAAQKIAVLQEAIDRVKAAAKVINMEASTAMRRFHST